MDLRGVSALILLAVLSGCSDKTDLEDSEASRLTDSHDTAGALDQDGDGFTAAEDCDDLNPEVSPEAEEVCDDIDNDCDASIDEGYESILWYLDADGDYYGTDDVTLWSCRRPTDYVDEGGDCDDTVAEIKPGAKETCDEVDEDCDDAVDEEAGVYWWMDSDGDGYGALTGSYIDCEEPEGYVDNYSDCDDTDAALNLDDADSDGWSTCDGDCVDTDDTIHPRVEDLCDDIDNDCDLIVDEEAPYWYPDGDGDGYGTSEDAVQVCEEPEGHSAVDGDCDDAEPAVSPGASEVCDDSVDNDCSGDVDCADGACSLELYCYESDCSDGDDEDRDGLVDCEDGDCSAELYCYESDCEDDDDEDDDGFVDCDDDDCWADAACELVIRVTGGQMVIDRNAKYDIYLGSADWPSSYTSATITDIVGTGEVAGEACVWSLERAHLQNTYVERSGMHIRQVIDRDGFDTDCVGLSVTDLPQSVDFGLGRIDTIDGGLWYHGGIDTWVGPRSSTWTYVFSVDATWYWRVDTLSPSDPWSVE